MRLNMHLKFNDKYYSIMIIIILYTLYYMASYKYKDVSICNFNTRSSQYIDINDIGYFENIIDQEQFQPQNLIYYIDSLFTTTITSNFKIQSLNIMFGKPTKSFIKCKTDIQYNPIIDALMPYSIYTYSQPNQKPILVPPNCKHIYAILVGGGGGGAGHNASNEFHKYPGGGGGSGGVVACIINVENLPMNSSANFNPSLNVSDPSYYGFYITVGYGGEGGYGTASLSETGDDGSQTRLCYRHPGQTISVGQGQGQDSSIRIIAHGGNGGGNINEINRNTYYTGGSGGSGEYTDSLNRIKWLNVYNGNAGETGESNSSIINSTSNVDGANGGKINIDAANQGSLRNLPGVGTLTIPNIKCEGGLGAPRNYETVINRTNKYEYHLERQQATGYGGGGGGAAKTDKGFDYYGGLYRGGNGSNGIAMIFFEF